MDLPYHPSTLFPSSPTDIHGTCHHSGQRRGVVKSRSYASGLRSLIGTGFERLSSGLIGGGGWSDSGDERFKTDSVEYEKDIRNGRLLRASTYEEFCQASAELDHLENAEDWKAEDPSDNYDFGMVKRAVAELRGSLESGDVRRMLRILKRCLWRDFAGLNNPALYEQSRLGTKVLIQRYITAVNDVLTAIVRSAERADLAYVEHVLTSLRMLQRQYGRTALLLSGGGTLGMNHVGVIKALFEADLLPRVVSGTSAGSIVAAVLCSRPDEQMRDALQQFCHGGDLGVFVGPTEEPGALARLTFLLHHGHLYDVENLNRVMAHWLQDTTFAEAYKRTDRILNIAVSSEKGSQGPALLNVYSTPNVLIRSAVVASCSVPLVFKPGKLVYKNPANGEILPYQDDETFIDGSLKGDIPWRDVSEKLSCNNFIVSQVNPHIRPGLNEAVANPRLRDRFVAACTDVAWSEMLHRIEMARRLGLHLRPLEVLHGLLEQPYTGNITILPNIDSGDKWRALCNPTPDWMNKSKINGERATWKKMNEIKHLLVIEKLLAEAVHSTAARHTTISSPTATDVRININRTKQPGEIRVSGRFDIEVEADDASPDGIAARLGRLFHKSRSQPTSPSVTNKRFFDSSPATPSSRSPAPAPLDLTMTPTAKHRGKSSDPQSHRRVFSDLSQMSSMSAESFGARSAVDEITLWRGQGTVVEAQVALEVTIEDTNTL